MQRGLAGRLLFLVRAADPEAGVKRLRSNLRALGATDADLSQLHPRQILVCDLDALSGIAGDPRLHRVAQLIHCAALATFSEHPALYQVNVDSTLALGGLMHGRAAFKRFLYVGTAMACGAQMNRSRPVAEQRRLSTLRQTHLVPYTHSKALAETLLAARYPDLPLVIARPSIIVGHTRLGCLPSQSIFWVLLVWRLLGVGTAALEDRIDVVPVDWCAGAIVDLALKESLSQSVFHLSAGADSSRTFRQIDKALSAAGWGSGDGVYEYIDPAEMDRLSPLIRQRVPDCNPRLLIRALKLYGGFARLAYVFDNRHLAAEGIGVSPPLTSYLDRCVASTRSIPIVTQMRYDFK
jgi:nucleoside-diphosphate-sugar epimerase